MKISDSAFLRASFKTLKGEKSSFGFAKTIDRVECVSQS